MLNALSRVFWLTSQTNGPNQSSKGWKTAAIVIIASITCFAAVVGVATETSAADETQRPNILWITSEDNGQQLGCYGDRYADTPNLDKLAESSLRYKTCWSNAPVCAPARTTIIAGMYATSTGGQHMRSGVKLPDSIQLYPELLREAGYYCTNHTKTDYNFDGEDGGWNESGKKAHYTNRPNKETPFFAIYNITVSHESKIRSRPHTLVHDPAKAPLPKYHPDTPEVRHDWAQYYDKMTAMDGEVGEILASLDKSGLRDSTIIFYYGDHGSGMPRSKRQPLDSGLRVPLLVSIPERFKNLAPADYAPGAVTERLVDFVDMAPTALSLAGAKAPANMQGVAFAGAHAGEPKEMLFGYRGRMDERIDLVRSCTDGRFVYVRNFYPDRPYLKHVQYMFETPTTQVWKDLFDAGKLNEAQSKYWQTRPAEELFDLQSDPDEVVNLAAIPAHAKQLKKMRSALKKWMIKTADTGLMTEAEMNARSQSSSPREVATAEDYPITKLVRVAFAATDTQSDLGPKRLVELAKNDDSRVRFWAVRGLALRGNVDALESKINDANASVCVAACDGILMAENSDAKLKVAATNRLVELANVKNDGHFVAVAALNVIDMRAEMTPTLRKQLAELPRSLPKPPARVGKYVGRLLDKLLATK